MTIGSNQSVTLAGDLLVNTNAAVTGSLTIGGATAATQTWVTNRSYLDTTAGDGRYALKTSLAAKQDLIGTGTSLNVGSLYINSSSVATESYVSTYYQGKITSSIPITMAGLTATSGNFQGGSLSAGTTTLGTTTINGNMSATGYVVGGTSSFPLYVLNSTRTANYATAFALYQGLNGDTVVNCAAGQQVQFKVNNVFRGEINSAGNLSVVGDVTAYSDAKLKENVRPIADATDLVGRLRGVQFDWKRDGRPGIGLIAQEVRDVVPEVVHARHDDEDDDVTLSIAYGNLVAVLVEAVKELSARVDQLEAHRKV